MGVVHDNNLGVAFAMTFTACFATALGGSVVFVPSLVKLASTRALAASLGLSAGVMMFVSLVDIIDESAESFVSDGYDESKAFIYSILCFFGGTVFMMAFNKVVKFVLECQDPISLEQRCEPNDKLNDKTGVSEYAHNHHLHESSNNHHHIGHYDLKPVVDTMPSCPCHSKDPTHDLDKLKQMAETMQAKQHRETQSRKLEPSPDGDSIPPQIEEVTIKSSSPDHTDDDTEKAKQQQLIRMSIANAFAVSMHNFPEGLATFVSTLKDPKIGGVLALAVALHSMPLGLCVSLPIYYATGNRLKAFSYALMSGLVQPMGAFLGWLVLAHCLTDKVYGIIYGLIAGMMVMISAKELLPTAHRYDPGDALVTYSFTAGMAVMGLSLILFSL